MWTPLFVVVIAIAIVQECLQVSGLDNNNNSNAEKVGFKKKCKFRFENCPVLSLCPESLFHVQIQNEFSCSDLQRKDIIKRIQRRNLGCGETNPLFGALVSLGGRCYFKSSQQYYSPSDYCLMSATEALTCATTFILPKCCGVTAAYTDITGRCQPTSRPYLPQVGDGRTKSTESGSKYLSFAIQPLHLEYPRNTSTFAGHAKFYLQESGVSFSPLTGVFLRGEFQPLSGNYCVEQAFASYGGGWNDRIRLFYDSIIEVEAQKYAVIVGVIWLSSIPFNLTSAILHVFILRRSVHGALLASYFIGGSFVRLMGATIQFNFYSEPINRDCSFLDIFQKLMYINTLSWMTLLNFNMWIAFRKLNHSQSRRHGVLCEYLSYLAFAIIFPCIVVFVTWKIGHFYRTAETPACVLYGLVSLVTFSVPIVILIIINFFLFLRTSLNIKGYRKSTEEILKDSHPVNGKTFRLFAKLFLMTGPIWVVRVLLLFSHLKSWYLSIGGVLLEAIFIAPDLIFFILIITDRDTWKSVQTTFCKRDDVLSRSVGSSRSSVHGRHLSLHRTYSTIPRTETSSCVTTPGSTSKEITERY